MLEFVAGLVLNSAGSFFYADMDPGTALTLDYVSILFQGSIDDRRLGPWFFCLSLLGVLNALKTICDCAQSAISVLCGQILNCQRRRILNESSETVEWAIARLF